MHVEEGPAGYSRGLHTFVLSRLAPVFGAFLKPM